MYSRSCITIGHVGSVPTRRRFSVQTGKQAIPRALYRQLLRWCSATEDEVPLSYFIPPVYMAPPQIDGFKLRALSKEERAMFPPKSIIDETHITCPINNSSDAKCFFRAVFRLNKQPATSAEEQKQRITLAFDGIRSLNELTQALMDLKRSRARHVLRENVQFHIGQVVKHKVEDWRGIVTGWQRMIPEQKDVSVEEPIQATSLTTKAYSVTDETHNIRYNVLLDSGDAHLHYSKRREHNTLNVAEAYQSDLQLVKDKSLLRIRSSHTAQHFKSFNSLSNSFVPNDIVAYEYPNDGEGKTVLVQGSDRQSEEMARKTIDGAFDMSEYLRRIVLDYTSAPEARGLKTVANVFDRLNVIFNGEVVSQRDRFEVEDLPNQKLASLYLQHLVSLAEDIGELLWQRRRSLESERNVKYGLGDVVRHTKYGFRGVVVAWDPEPSLDVSRWDGLQHIKNPEQYPFYHIIPDQNDCVEAFGGERPSRYVCEANLEVCSMEDRIIDVDLEPEWEFDRQKGVYVPPEELLFKYGGDLKDDGVTRQCLLELRDAMASLFVAIRDSKSTGSGPLDSIARKITLEGLMKILQNSKDMETATTISDCLKEIWRANQNTDQRDRLDTGIGALLGGRTELALGIFMELIDENPEYAEAWNKASTCEFMLGNMDASLLAAQKTLELVPSHFQAQNGLGLVYYEKKDLQAAADSFRKSIELDPWSPVSARLSVCLDTLAQWKRPPLK